MADDALIARVDDLEVLVKKLMAKVFREQEISDPLGKVE